MPHRSGRDHLKVDGAVRLEQLEPRVLLSSEVFLSDQDVSAIRAGFGALEGTIVELTESVEFSAEVPFGETFGRTVDEIVGLTDQLTNLLISARGYLETESSPSYDGLFDRLYRFSMTPLSPDQLAVRQQLIDLGVLSMNGVDLLGTQVPVVVYRSLEGEPLKFDLSAATDELAFNGALDVEFDTSSELRFTAVLTLGASDDGIASGVSVELPAAGNRLALNVADATGAVGATIGVLGATLDVTDLDFTLSGQRSSDLTVSLADLAGVGLSNFFELQAGGADPYLSIDAMVTGDLETSDGVLSLVNSAFTVTDQSLTDDVEPVVSLESFDADAEAFRAITAAGLYQAIEQASDVFDSFGESNAFDMEIPFSGGKTLRDVIDLSSAFKDAILGRITLPVLPGEIAEEGESGSPSFVSVQEMIGQLAELGERFEFRAAEGDRPAQLLFDLSFDYTFLRETFELALNQGLGDLNSFDLAAAADLLVDATLEADFRLGVNLQRPSEGFGLTAETTLRELNGFAGLSFGEMLLTDQADEKQDILVTLRNGNSFTVDLDAAGLSNESTVGALIGAFEAARASAQGTDDAAAWAFTLSIDEEANELVATDGTMPTGVGPFPDFTIGRARYNNPVSGVASVPSVAAIQLGFDGKAGVDGVLRSGALDGRTLADIVFIRPFYEASESDPDAPDLSKIQPVLTLTVTFSASDVDAAANLGVIGISVEDGVATGVIQATFAPRDPAIASADGNITLREFKSVLPEARSKIVAPGKVSAVGEAPEGSEDDGTPRVEDAYGGILTVEIEAIDPTAEATTLYVPFFMPENTTGISDATLISAELNVILGLLAAGDDPVQPGSDMISFSSSDGKLTVTLADGIARRVTLKRETDVFELLKQTGVAEALTPIVERVVESGLSLLVPDSLREVTEAVESASRFLGQYVDAGNDLADGIDEIRQDLQDGAVNSVTGLLGQAARALVESQVVPRLEAGLKHLGVAADDVTSDASAYVARPAIDSSGTVNLPVNLDFDGPGGFNIGGLELPPFPDIGFDLPEISLSLFDLDVPDFRIPNVFALDLGIFEGFGDLLSLKELPLSALIRALQGGLEFLEGLEFFDQLPFFNANIPLLDINLGDILDIANVFGDLVVDLELQLQRGELPDLGVFDDLVEDLLNIPESAGAGNEALPNFVVSIFPSFNEADDGSPLTYEVDGAVVNLRDEDAFSPLTVSGRTFTNLKTFLRSNVVQGDHPTVSLSLDKSQAGRPALRIDMALYVGEGLPDETTGETSVALGFDWIDERPMEGDSGGVVTPIRSNPSLLLDLSEFAADIPELGDLALVGLPTGGGMIDLDVLGRIDFALGVDLALLSSVTSQEADLNPFLYSTSGGDLSGTRISVLAQTGNGMVTLGGTVGGFDITADVDLAFGADPMEERGGYGRFSVGLRDVNDGNADGRVYFGELADRVSGDGMALELRDLAFEGAGSADVGLSLVFGPGSATLGVNLGLDAAVQGLDGAVLAGTLGAEQLASTLASSITITDATVGGSLSGLLGELVALELPFGAFTAGWSQFFGTVDTAFDSALFSLTSIPFIGPELATAFGDNNPANFLGDFASRLTGVSVDGFQEDVAEAFGEIVVDSVTRLPLADGADPITITGSGFSGYDVAFAAASRFEASLEESFGVGIDGFGLDLSAGTTVGVELFVRIVGGLDLTNGFFIDTTESTIEVILDAAPTLEAMGTLGLISIDGTPATAEVVMAAIGGASLLRINRVDDGENDEINARAGDFFRARTRIVADEADAGVTYQADRGALEIRMTSEQTAQQVLEMLRSDDVFADGAGQLFEAAFLEGADASGKLAPNEMEAGNGFGGLFAASLVDFKDGAPATAQNPGDGKLSIFEISQAGSPRDLLSFESAAVASFDLLVEAQQFEVPGLDVPNILIPISGVLTVDWEIDPLGEIADQALLPIVAIRDVTLDAGAFFNGFIKDALASVTDVLEPINDITSIFATEIPVISELDGPVTFLDLARLTGGRVEAAVRFIEAVRQVYALADAAERVAANLGDEGIVLGGASFNPNTKEFSFGTVYDPATGMFVDDPMIDPDAVRDQVNSTLASAASGVTNGQASSAESAFTLDGTGSMDGEFEVSFPVLNPSNIFGLLSGNVVDLVLLDLPVFEYELNFSAFYPLPPFPAVGVEIGGSLGARIDLKFGYDSQGLIDFQGRGGFDGIDFDVITDPEHPDFDDNLETLGGRLLLLGNGFFVSDGANADGTGADVPELTLTGSITAAAALNAGLLKARVGGGLFATIDFNLHDIPDGSGNVDGKIRAGELAENFDLGIIHIFDVSGKIEAGLFADITVDFGLGTVEESFTLATIELVSFTFPRPVSAAPVIATASGGVLTLNMSEGDDVFSLTQLPDTGDETGRLLVELGGQSRVFAGISTVRDNGVGGGNDTITLDASTIRLDISTGDGDDMIVGGDADDIIRGGAGRDVIVGRGGDDDLSGNDDADEIFGGLGGDIISGGDGNDRLDGEAGIDIISGDGGDDEISAGDGGDFVFGGDGADSITAGDGDDTVRGGAGSDEISGGRGADVLMGDAGDDNILGGVGNDTIGGGAGNDLILGEQGIDTLSGDDGDDVIQGGEGEDGELRGGAGDDRLYPNAVDDLDDLIAHSLFGEAGNDMLFGTQHADLLDGGADDDEIFGHDGDDHIEGQAGDDLIIGGLGADYIDAGADNDTVFGDTRTGLEGAGDFIILGAGADTAFGEAGRDVIFGFNAMTIADRAAFDALAMVSLFGGPAIVPGGGVIDLVNLDPNSSDGTDRISGGADGDWIFGGAGRDELYGDAGADYIAAGAGDDMVVSGGADGDVIFGNDGADELDGDEGGDYLFGNAGPDVLFGGQSEAMLEHDGMVFRQRLDGGTGDDVLYAWASEADRLDPVADTLGDWLLGGDNDDVLLGNLRADRLEAGDGDNFVHGDYLDGPSLSARNFDLLRGGNDLITAGSGRDQIYGGGGVDDVTAGAGDDYIDGQGGADILRGEEGIDTFVSPNIAAPSSDQILGDPMPGVAQATDILAVTGTSLSESIVVAFSTTASQLILRFGETTILVDWNDGVSGGIDQITIAGLGGDDVLGFAFEGAGVLAGLPVLELRDGERALVESDLLTNPVDYSSVILGGGGDDRIAGSPLRDYADGEGGSDTLYGFEGDDRLWGGLKGSASDVDVVFAGQGNDDVVGGSGRNVLAAWSHAPDYLDTLIDEDRGDALPGWVNALLADGPDEFGVRTGDDLELTGVNRILGGERDDILLGGTVLDFLHGNGGTDRLVRADGTLYERADDGAAGDDWKSFAAESDLVWYYAGLEQDDEIEVRYFTSSNFPTLEGRHGIIRDSTGDGEFTASDISFRLGYDNPDFTDLTTPDAAGRYAELLQRRADGGLDDRQTAEIADELEGLRSELFGLLLPPEGDFIAIIIDALGGDDTITVDASVQKSVWVDGGAGDDTIILESGGGLLQDRADEPAGTNAAGRNEAAATAYSLGSLTQGVFSGLTLHEPEDVDYFAFELDETLPAGAALELRTDITSAGLNVDVLDASAPDGEALRTASFDDGDEQWVADLEGLGAGEYLLRISATARVIGRYDFRVWTSDDRMMPLPLTDLGSSTEIERRDVVFGGAGDDLIRGGSGEDWIFGNDGNDVLSGGADRQASDLIFGGAGNDTLQVEFDRLPDSVLLAGTLFDPPTPGEEVTVSDQFFGGAGDDRILLPGEVVRNGTTRLEARDVVALRYDPDRARYVFGALQPEAVSNTQVGFVFEGGTPVVRHMAVQPAGTEQIQIDLGGGDDMFRADEGFTFPGDVRVWGVGDDERAAGASLLDLVIRGGDGNDTLVGGAGHDVLVGDDGDDLLVGGPGDDRAFGESDDDTLIGGLADVPEPETAPAATAGSPSEPGAFANPLVDDGFPVGPTATLDLTGAAGREVLDFEAGDATAAGERLLDVRSIGDVTGDGRDDLLVVGADESYLFFRPSTFVESEAFLAQLEQSEIDLPSFRERADIIFVHDEVGVPGTTFGDHDADGVNDLSFVLAAVQETLVTVRFGGSSMFDLPREPSRADLVATDGRTIRLSPVDIASADSAGTPIVELFSVPFAGGNGDELFVSSSSSENAWVSRRVPGLGGFDFLGGGLAESVQVGDSRFFVNGGRIWEFDGSSFTQLSNSGSVPNVIGATTLSGFEDLTAAGDRLWFTAVVPSLSNTRQVVYWNVGAQRGDVIRYDDFARRDAISDYFEPVANVVATSGAISGGAANLAGTDQWLYFQSDVVLRDNFNRRADADMLFRIRADVEPIVLRSQIEALVWLPADPQVEWATSGERAFYAGPMLTGSLNQFLGNAPGSSVNNRLFMFDNAPSDWVNSPLPDEYRLELTDLLLQNDGAVFESPNAYRQIEVDWQGDVVVSFFNGIDPEGSGTSAELWTYKGSYDGTGEPADWRQYAVVREAPLIPLSGIVDGGFVVSGRNIFVRADDTSEVPLLPIVRFVAIDRDDATRAFEAVQVDAEYGNGAMAPIAVKGGLVVPGDDGPSFVGPDATRSARISGSAGVAVTTLGDTVYSSDGSTNQLFALTQRRVGLAFEIDGGGNDLSIDDARIQIEVVGTALPASGFVTRFSLSGSGGDTVDAGRLQYYEADVGTGGTLRPRDGEDVRFVFGSLIVDQPIAVLAVDADGDLGTGTGDEEIALVYPDRIDLVEDGVVRAWLTFAAPIGGGVDLAAGDFDGDGLHDIAITSRTGVLRDAKIIYDINARPGPINVETEFATWAVADGGNGHSYAYVPGGISWSEARQAAEDLGGHLLTVNSRAEEEWVFQNLLRPAAFNVGREQYVWLGATDEAAEGTVRWLTDEPWDYVNPVNDLAGFENDYFALGIDPTGVQRWVGSPDTFATTAGVILMGYVVEFGGATVASEWGADAGGDGTAYEFVHASVSWEEAQAIADSRGGHLATIGSQAEQTWITETLLAPLAQDDSRIVWLGGTDAETDATPDEDEGVWRWVTGEPFDNDSREDDGDDSDGFTDWRPGEPNNGPVGGNEDYLHLFFSTAGNLGWNDTTLDSIESQRFGFVIEYTGSAPTRNIAVWSQADGGNGAAYVRTNPLSDSAAAAAAASIGGVLFQPNNEAEQQFVDAMLADGAGRIVEITPETRLESSGSGTFLSLTSIDLNGDDIDDLAAIDGGSSSGSLYLVDGSRPRRDVPGLSAIELSNATVPGVGGILRGPNRAVFAGSDGVAYALEAGESQWYRFRTVGDGTAEHGIGLARFGGSPRLSLYDAAGRQRGQSVGEFEQSQVRLPAGEYFVLVENAGLSRATFTIAINAPFLGETHVGERDRDVLYGGDGVDTLIGGSESGVAEPIDGIDFLFPDPEDTAIGHGFEDRRAGSGAVTGSIDAPALLAPETSLGVSPTTGDPFAAAPYTAHEGEILDPRTVIDASLATVADRYDSISVTGPSLEAIDILQPLPDNGEYLIRYQGDAVPDVVGRLIVLNVDPVSVVEVTGSESGTEPDAYRATLGESVVFDASASSDVGSADALSFLWEIETASGRLVAPFDGAVFDFLAQAVDLYDVRLTVSDGDDAVERHFEVAVGSVGAIVLENASPISEGALLTFRVDAERGPIGSERSYRWTVRGELGALLDERETVSPTFVWQAGADGVFDAEVTVVDTFAGVGGEPVEVAGNGSAIAFVVTNGAPVIAVPAGGITLDQGLDPVRIGSDAVTVVDPGGDQMAVTYSLLDSSGTRVAFGLGRPPSFVFSTPGNFTLRIDAIDVDGSPIVTATTPVRVRNVAPIAIAELSDVVVADGEIVQLSGIASGDAGGDPIEYEWFIRDDRNEIVARELGAPEIDFLAQRSGSHTAELVVTDPHGGRATVTSTFEVLNAAPTLGAPQLPDRYEVGEVAEIRGVFTDFAGDAPQVHAVGRRAIAGYCAGHSHRDSRPSDRVRVRGQFHLRRHPG